MRMKIQWFQILAVMTATFGIPGSAFALTDAEIARKFMDHRISLSKATDYMTYSKALLPVFKTMDKYCTGPNANFCETNWVQIDAGLKAIREDIEELSKKNGGQAKEFALLDELIEKVTKDTLLKSAKVIKGAVEDIAKLHAVVPPKPAAEIETAVKKLGKKAHKEIDQILEEQKKLDEEKAKKEKEEEEKKKKKDQDDANAKKRARGLHLALEDVNQYLFDVAPGIETTNDKSKVFLFGRVFKACEKEFNVKFEAAPKGSTCDGSSGFIITDNKGAGRACVQKIFDKHGDQAVCDDIDPELECSDLTKGTGTDLADKSVKIKLIYLDPGKNKQNQSQCVDFASGELAHKSNAEVEQERKAEAEAKKAEKIKDLWEAAACRGTEEKLEEAKKAYEALYRMGEIKTMSEKNAKLEVLHQEGFRLLTNQISDLSNIATTREKLTAWASAYPDDTREVIVALNHLAEVVVKSGEQATDEHYKEAIQAMVSAISLAGATPRPTATVAKLRMDLQDLELARFTARIDRGEIDEFAMNLEYPKLLRQAQERAFKANSNRRGDNEERMRANRMLSGVQMLYSYWQTRRNETQMQMGQFGQNPGQNFAQHPVQYQNVINQNGINPQGINPQTGQPVAPGQITIGPNGQIMMPVGTSLPVIDPTTGQPVINPATGQPYMQTFGNTGVNQIFGNAGVNPIYGNFNPAFPQQGVPQALPVQPGFNPFGNGFNPVIPTYGNFQYNQNGIPTYGLNHQAGGPFVNPANNVFNQIGSSGYNGYGNGFNGLNNLGYNNFSGFAPANRIIY